MKFNSNSFAAFLLRIGLATVFLYAAIATFLDPTSWEGFIPQEVGSIVPSRLVLTVFSFYQIGLSLWLLSTKKAFAATITASITLVAIIIANINYLDIVFRDVAILFSAFALMVISREKNE